MTRFDILDRQTSVHRNTFLEASAGTGKTFSIENMVVRLLLEEPCLSIQQILVVTFTREATRDLSRRIGSHLRAVLEVLSSEDQASSTPDYLLAIQEQGLEKREQARRRILHALYCFEEAQIFTIHSFCMRMLSVHQAFRSEEEPLQRKDLLPYLRDFFRTQITHDLLTPWQLERLLQEYRTLASFETSIAAALENGTPLLPFPKNGELYSQIQGCMDRLRRDEGICPETLRADAEALSPLFRKPAGKETQEQMAQQREKFFQLFSDFSLETFFQVGDSWNRSFHPALLKKRGALPLEEHLHHPGLASLLEQEWLPIWRKGAEPALLFARVAYYASQQLQRVLAAEEKGFYDDWLKEMDSALQDSSLCEAIRNRYRAVIVDEFQDTDPLQWKIFSRLFPPHDQSWGHLALVGDPKQSIYAFRRADIYTYLSAAEAMGEESRAQLDTNFRSTPALVDALNRLFQDAPGWMFLPQKEGSLPYHPVEAGKREEAHFTDGRGALHLLIAETEEKRRGTFPLQELESKIFFPFIAEEIMALHQKQGVAYSDIAILVRDRFQSARLLLFLEEAGIPAQSRQREPLSSSPAWTALRHLLMALGQPRSVSRLKSALSSPLLGWHADELASIDRDEDKRAQLLAAWLELHAAFQSKGLPAFFRALWLTRWEKREDTPRERLLQKDPSQALCRDAEQIIRFLLQEERKGPFSLKEALLAMDLEEEKQEILRSPDLSTEGVILQTIHSSKGLEYRIVFGLGLMVPTTHQPSLFPAGSFLVPNSIEYQEEYRRFCYENDAEKMRQLYVACTRAKERLYLPVVACRRKEVPEPGTPSPIELFLARFLQAPATMGEVYERLQAPTTVPLQLWVDERAGEGGIRYSLLEKSEIMPRQQREKRDPPPLTAPEKIILSYPKRERTSFSRLMQQKEISFRGPQEKMPGDLPMGAAFGVYIHALLEKISFRPFAAWQEILPLLPKNEAFDEWKEPIAQMIYQVMHCSLPGAGGSFSLGSLDSQNMLRECEFFFLEKSASRTMTFQGSIDLAFSFQGKDYLIDWKTNRLGSLKEDYSQDKMEEEMRRHDYFLQAAIYAEAWRRYRQGLMPREIGGIFYLFLRGLDEKLPYGIYCVPAFEWEAAKQKLGL